MKQEKMIADQLQAMFLEGKLNGFKEEYINQVTRKLWAGEIGLANLLLEHSELKDKVVEARERILPLFFLFNAGQ